MPALRTDAIVLHAFDYLETSRIFRVATREAGLQSVLARGARRARTRYGTALDLFASGVAELSVRPGRDLQTLIAFDVTRSRAALAADLERFTAASMIAELAMRFGTDEAQAELFEVLVSAFDAVAASPSASSIDAALGGAWRLVAELGFAPALDACASCHVSLDADLAAVFSHRTGGLLCQRCASLAGAARRLPVEARDAVRAWMSGAPVVLADPLSRRAHQRLLREFLNEHLTDGRALRAYDVWERSGWSAAAETVP